MSKGTVISLCDYTGNMVKPWAEAGYRCFTVDIRDNPNPHEGVEHFAMSASSFRLFRGVSPSEACAVFAFPPCTNTAVSGARWFKQKGPRAAAESFSVLADCIDVIERCNCPWMVENPISTFSTYWRKPDYIFNPWQYGDGYDKKTCLWTGGGFVMPEPTVPERPEDTDQRIHRMPPGPDRQHLRSVTPMGFARAVFAANHPQVEELIAMDSEADHAE